MFKVSGSHIFRLRSCSKIFESGFEVFSNLIIRLLFRLRQTLIQPKSNSVYTQSSDIYKNHTDSCQGRGAGTQITDSRIRLQHLEVFGSGSGTVLSIEN